MKKFLTALSISIMLMSFNSMAMASQSSYCSGFKVAWYSQLPSVKLSHCPKKAKGRGSRKGDFNRGKRLGYSWAKSYKAMQARKAAAAKRAAKARSNRSRSRRRSR